LQIEDQSGIGLGQTQQRRRLGRHIGFAVRQQRQILGRELRKKIARGLRPRGSSPWAEGPRQIMSEQQSQRLVLTKLVEVFRPLATSRPSPAAHSANRLSTISAAARPRLRLFNWISRSITVAVPLWRNPAVKPGHPPHAR
jgi:hypothetical protein